ncbi:hypothetical protein [Flavisolibacter ginsenosidimutans]|uniref:DUF4339 domain-containing protein n=1 Tax=Flavisolibacter ginsenosidimutans TaxID=661481 RepID=A0A5B8UEJ4_9BACT|nr:hypothetical protein [Flavisolibacter ginsenosidimutans]QEC55101.1 hypothetical protein FSB75_04000 [Flavisolibacter ginsenosidimutans]
MKRYFLLRSNREAGPFTSAELKTCGLLPTDLIWIENESTSWQHPTEIEELKTIAANGFKKEAPSVFSAPVKPPVPSLQEYKRAIGESDLPEDNEAELTTYHYHSKQSLRRKQKPAANSYTVGSRFFGAVVLLIGLVLCGFVVVNMLNQFGLRRAADSEAVEIKSEILPASNTAHMAQALPHVSLSQPAPSEVKAIDSVHAKLALAKKTVKHTETNKKMFVAKPDTSFGNSNVAKAEDAPLVNEAVQKPAEEKPEATAVVSRTPSLQLSANDYKVGLFGGISDLEISVTNPSTQKINRAVIEVEYLKPNGSAVKSQTVTAENISPNGSRIVVVPPSSRGVKVRYHVTSVE